MSKPSATDNFTPVFDGIVRELGLIAAAVYGRVWRYCQGSRGVCQASQRTIAEDIGVCLRTVTRWLHVLVKTGYLIDHTPGLRNRPHTYSTTGKASTMSERHTSEMAGMPESHSGTPESHSGYARESHEETRRDNIRDKKQAVSLDSSFPIDSHFEPRPPEEEKPSILAQTDPLSLSAEVERRGNGKKPWSVVGPDGANPYEGEPLAALRELLNMPELPPPKKRRQWGQKLRQIGETWEATPPMLAEAIRGIRESKDHQWRSFTSPFAKSFEEVVGVMITRVRSGERGNVIRM